MSKHVCDKVVIEKISGAYIATSMIYSGDHQFIAMTYSKDGQLFTDIQHYDIDSDEKNVIIPGPIAVVTRDVILEHHNHMLENIQEDVLTALC